ncbi:MAG: methyltransferase domain-containing protein [Actinomycetota bacterium]
MVRTGHALEAPTAPQAVKRLNWGCGAHVRQGWINSDIKPDSGVDLVCDIRTGLLLESDSVDYAVSIHALPELSYPEVVPALEELRRVLRPDGVLRLGLPDLHRAIQAYVLGKEDYFQVNQDQIQSSGGRFIAHILWYGYSRTLFITDFIEELMIKAGFVAVEECQYQRTASPFPEIVELDNRERESLFVEGTKPVGSHASQSI